MPEVAQPPFHSFSFTLIEDKKPRCAFRLRHLEDGMYELHVEKGSAANPISQFTRKVPLESAQRFKDNLQAAGAFGWDEKYGDVPGAPMLRWNVSTVFKEDVFTVASAGGSAVPVGFDALLEELYRMDFPRPDQPREAFGGAAGAAGTRGAAGTEGMFGQSGALGAAGALGSDLGVDFSQLSNLMGQNGLAGLDATEMLDLLSQARTNPQALQQRMREEFRHMPHDEQERMLDALAQSGLASRAWWERFLRG